MIAPCSADTVLPIDQLRANEQAHVVDLVGEGNEVHRLAEMGLRIGCSIRMVRPGSPCLLALDGKRMSIRLNNSVDILVAAISPA